MRILYGVHTQGQGGLTKASILVPLLEERGFDVQVVSSGSPPPKCFRFRKHLHLPGMEYAVIDGQVSIAHTTIRWLRGSGTIWQSLSTLRTLLRDVQPELIISDFEPYSASPLLGSRCEVIAASRPASLLDPDIPLPETSHFQRKITRTAIRMFCGGADRRLGYHLEPRSHRCLAPPLAPEIRSLAPVRGEHWLVYNTYNVEADTNARLIAWAQERRERVIVYGCPAPSKNFRHPQVEFRAPSRSRFLHDLATCRGVIATAGLSLPLEAAALGKPCCVIPIPRQWEQEVNAFHLVQAGLVRRLAAWDYDALTETPPPVIAPAIRNWLDVSPEQTLQTILGESWHAVTKPSPRRHAA